MASCFFSSAAAIACRALAVIACNKDGRDGEQVLLELGCVRLSVVARACVENHEADAGLPQHVLDEIKGDAAKSVAVGNNNLLDASLHRAFQNGRKTAALEVDARRNISNELVFGIET
jgi:hypothetical protein